MGSAEKQKVAMLYVCTGKYSIFWKDFYCSFEKFFLTDYEKEYFVFTDQNEIYGEDENRRIHRIEQQDLGWPGNTLMRFDMFSNYASELIKFDYIFFMNANAECVREVQGEEILSDKPGIIVVQHPNFTHTNKYLFPYERDKRSTAYIPYDKGRYYVIGAINGGTSAAYLGMIKQLKKATDEDLSNGIVAIWHDESQLNHFVAYSQEYKILDPSFCYPEGWKLPYQPAIVMRDKNKYFNVAKLKNNTKQILVDGIKRRVVYVLLCISDIFKNRE